MRGVSAPPKYVVRHSFWEWEQRAPVAESSYLSSSDPDLVEVPPKILGELLKRLPIHSGRARIGFDRFVGVVH